MANPSQTTSTEDFLDGTRGLAVGLGIITMTLFPLALPLLALTAVALVPLVLIPLAGGLLALPFLLLRRAFRKVRASAHMTSPAGEVDVLARGV